MGYFFLLKFDSLSFDLTSASVISSHVIAESSIILVKYFPASRLCVDGHHRCLSCKKDTKNIDPKVIKTKNNRKMMLSRCSICNNKKSTFISQESGLFDSLGLNKPQNRMKNVLWNAFR